MGFLIQLDAPLCQHCGGVNVKLRRQIIGNGTNQIAWYCLACGRWAEIPPHWLPHARFITILGRYGKHLEDLPIVEDYSGQHPCIICGEPGEWHHWAPRALADQFDEWSRWPCVYLCRKHHREWHNAVTPELVGGQLEILGETLH